MAGDGSKSSLDKEQKDIGQYIVKIVVFLKIALIPHPATSEVNPTKIVIAKAKETELAHL